MPVIQVPNSAIAQVNRFIYPICVAIGYDKSVMYAFEKLAQCEAWLKKAIQALMQKLLPVTLRFNHWLFGVEQKIG